MKPRNTGGGNSNKERVLVPSGTHFSRIVSVVFAGAIEGYYKGAKTDPRDKLIISYELSHKMRKGKDDKDVPFVISKEYAFFYGGTAHLRKDIEALLGRTMTEAECDFNNADGMFDPSTLLGKTASVTIVHNVSKTNNKTYVNCKTVAAVPEPYCNELPQPVRELVSFDITEFMDLQLLMKDPTFKNLNKFLKGKVESSVEYKTLVEMSNQNQPPATNPLGTDNSNVSSADDLPF